MTNENEARINALRQLLTETDYQAIKHSEGIISAGDYEPIRLQRQAWRDEINELELKEQADAVVL